jgi:hypothetical protein
MGNGGLSESNKVALGGDFRLVRRVVGIMTFVGVLLTASPSSADSFVIGSFDWEVLDNAECAGLSPCVRFTVYNLLDLLAPTDVASLGLAPDQAFPNATVTELGVAGAFGDVPFADSRQLVDQYLLVTATLFFELPTLIGTLELPQLNAPVSPGTFVSADIVVVPVTEPATFGLLAIGVVAGQFARRRTRRLAPTPS